jgi:hypothetical protein
MMKKAKRLSDTALRQQVAQWTRAALGELVKTDTVESDAEPIIEQSTYCIVGCESAETMLVQLLALDGITEIMLEENTDFKQDF